jgi:flagellar hook-associated protein 1 FlgK
MQRTVVGYPTGGANVTLADASLQGGMLGGLLSFRSGSLDAAQNSLGRVAMGLAQSFNAQHALGQDLNGALGGNFFSVSSPIVLPDSHNAGTGGVSATLQDASALTTSDYKVQYQGNSGGNENFLLTRLSDGVTTAASFAASGYPHTMSVDGLNITLSAGASLHDNWVIEPTRLGANNMTVLVKDATGIAAAAPIRAAAALANSSAATISAGAVTSAASLPLSATISLTFDAVNSRFNVAGAVPAVAPIAYSSGNAVSFNGLSFTISGTPANGDVFTVERNAGGSVDNRNALMLGALQTTNTIGRDASVAGSLASTTYNGAYAELVSQIGNTARQTELMATAQTNVITQAKQAQQSVSGVNLDEEAANLLRYQQAYQASGKMMQIASTLFQTLLDLGR